MVGEGEGSGIEAKEDCRLVGREPDEAELEKDGGNPGGKDSARDDPEREDERPVEAVNSDWGARS